MTKCFFGHDWSPWREIETGQLGRKDRNGATVPIGNYVVQRRTCKACGKHKLDTQRTYATH